VRQDIPLTGNTNRGQARLKHVLTGLISGGTPDTNNDDYWSDGDEGIAWVAIGDMSTKALVLATEKRITESGLASKRLHVMPPGTLIYSMYASMGHVAELAIPATINQALLGFQFIEHVSPSFCKWWLRHLQPMLLAEANSNTQDNLNADKVKNLPFPSTSLASQISISAYLDRETALIDKLIGEKERMLALLEEKRAALISQVVTRGLNPDVPLKDSGQEWLGMIPAHWKPLRLKNVIDRVDQSSSPQCHSYSAEPGQWGVLKTGCVNGGIFREFENKVLPEDTDPFPEAEVHKGDVLMSRASGSVDLIGSVAYVSKQPLARLLLSDKIYRLRPSPRLIEAQFLALAMQSHYLRYQVKASISGADGLANNIAKRDIMDLFLIVPPYEEQKMIVYQANEISKAITNLVENLKISVSLVKERRMAIITDSVSNILSTEHSCFDANSEVLI